MILLELRLCAGSAKAGWNVCRSDGCGQGLEPYNRIPHAQHSVQGEGGEISFLSLHKELFEDG